MLHLEITSSISNQHEIFTVLLIIAADEQFLIKLLKTNRRTDEQPDRNHFFSHSNTGDEKPVCYPLLKLVCSQSTNKDT